MKLHIGCGSKFIPDFTHIDARKFKHVDIVAKADKIPLDDNSAELIYACHILEHFGRHEYINALQEWHRLLKVDGILRLSVPDFDAINLWYIKSGSLDSVMGLLYGRQDYSYNFHKVTFNFKTLRNDLEKIGFKDVYRYDWRNTEHANVDDLSQAYLPHMDKANGLLMSLNIEAVKI